MAQITTKTLLTADANITFVTFDLEGRALPARLRDTLLECDRLVGLDNVARQTFFLSRKADPEKLAHVIEQAYGRPAPVTSYVSQPPAEGHAVSCELWAFPSGATLQRGRHVTAVSTPAGKWGFVGGMESTEDEPPGRSVQRILGEAQQELRRAGMALAQMVRTWYYIGDILGTRGKGSRYAQFNAARNEFYRSNWPDLCRSPASTGIGMNTDRVAFEGLLVSPVGDSPRVRWIDNPLQTPPHLYEGQTGPDCNPSFSRAAAVRLGNAAVLFISGTASIRGSDVISPEDPEAQTKTTIENIATLIGADNLVRKHGFSRGATLADLQQFRVYVKRPGDLDIVRDCCRRHLPPVPHTYLVADICRPEFLVEIEGVAAFAHDA